MESRDKAGLKDLKDLIQSIGGWSMIDSNWDAVNYHWEDAYAKVNKLVNLPFPFLFEVIPDYIVIPDYTNSSQNILMVKFIIYKAY